MYYTPPQTRPAAVHCTLPSIYPLPPDPSHWHHMHIYLIHLVGCQVPKAGVHWRLFLQIGQNQSVRVDIHPTGDDYRTGQVEMKDVSYAYSSNLVAGTESDVDQPLTPVGFKEMLRHYHLDRYRYAPGPRGCCYWCITVMKYLMYLGFVSSAAISYIEDEYFPQIHLQKPHIYPCWPVEGEFVDLYAYFLPVTQTLF